MDLEQRLRTGLVAPDPGATFTARVMARVGRGATRRRGSYILISTLLVVGAAAAMLAWRMLVVQPPPVEVIKMATARDPEPVAQDPLVQSLLEVEEPVAPLPPPEPTLKQVFPQYSVLVMPLRHEAQDVIKRGPVESLYAAMLDELRKVPGLTLHLSDDSERIVDDQAAYVLTITSLAADVSQSGGVVFRSTDGGDAYTVNGSGTGKSVSFDIEYTAPRPGTDAGASSFSGGQGSVSAVSAGGGVVSFNAGGLGNPEGVLWVEIKVESRHSAASRYTWPVGVEGAPEPRRCDDPNTVRPPECMTPAQLAAAQVEVLRLQVFPPDAAFQQRVVGRLGDPGQDQAGRMKLLENLLPGLTGDRGSRVDAGTVHAVARYAAGLPADTRASVWRMLSQASHPALVAPLVESLRRDPDQNVRLAALANLEANYFTNPVVRSAFERAEREDPDAAMRAAVRWALYGQARWRGDVLAALHDTSLPYDARLAPLIARTSADYSPQLSAQMSLLRRGVLEEGQVLRPVMVLVREHLRESEHAQVTGEVLGLLGNVDDPDVFDLFIQLMRETSLPIQMSGPIGNWAINHQNDPRVRDSLPLVEPTIPSKLLERMREITEKSVSPALLTQ
jgi:hypothetical protein